MIRIYGKLEQLWLPSWAVLRSALAAKFQTKNWKIANYGALMNTRGLMELIVLNIGLELKV
jgi:hypothetical protein